MEGKESGIPRRIPRLSRLPVPRPAATNAVDIHHDDGHKVSQLPRPSAANSLRSKTGASVCEATDQPPLLKYGRIAQQPRNLLPVKHIPLADQSDYLISTPSKNDAFNDLHVDEHAVFDLSHDQSQKRKPRPSLSERTMETLSQIPPSPSPSRPRPGTATGHFSMRAPITPASALRSSRSNASLRDRSSSPSKQASYRFGHPGSRLKGTTPLRATSDSATVHSSVQPTTTGSRIATGIGKRISSQQSPSVDEDEQVQGSSSSSISHTRQPRPSFGAKSTTSRTSVIKPSPHPTSEDLPKPTATNHRPSAQIGPSRNRVIKQPKVETTQKDVATPSYPSSASKPRLMAKNKQNANSVEDSFQQDTRRSISKSSLTLRETIAKAKAAKRAADEKRPSTPPNSKYDSSMPSIDFEIETPTAGNNSDKIIKKRIEGAVTSGVLNIAAMGLKTFPGSIRTMYDSNAGSKMNWSEAVDLVKLNAADNEIEELPEAFFPDWSIQELQDDEDKSNQFGGLQVLDLRGNQIAALTIGLRRLEQLQTLVLNNNRLEIDALEIVCQIHNLKELQLSNNSLIGALPSALETLTELQVLDLHSNRLSMLPENVARLHKLRKLDLSDNCFDAVPIMSLRDLPLVELNLSKNSLSGTFFNVTFNNERLQVLNVASNMLGALSEGDFDFPALQTLVCENNRMKSLPDMSKLKSLISLAASDNQIERFPDGFKNIKTLRNVDLSANQISVLDVQIANMENLTILNLSANPLRERKYLSMSTDKLKEDLSRRLQVITATDEIIGTIVGDKLEGTESDSVDHPEKKYTPEKGVLNLSSQNLKAIDISTIDLAGPVHTLRLSNNNFTEFPMELLSHHNIKHTLRSLDLSHTPSLHSTEYLTTNLELPLLQSLNIVSTGLTSLEALMTYLSAPQLKELNISCHRLTGPVPSVRTSFPALTTLLATDNWFTSIDVEAIKGLEVVDISNNDIEHLPPKIGELGNSTGSKAVPGRLRAFECTGNRFRVPRATVLEKGTEATLKDLRRMVPAELVGDAWKE